MEKIFEAMSTSKLKIGIGQCDYIHLDKSWNRGANRDPFSRLYFIRDGHGVLQAGDKTIEMTGGNVYFVPADCEMSYSCTYLEKLYFHITITSVEKYDLLSDIKDIYALPFADVDFQELLDCFLSRDYLKLIKLRMLLEKTILDFAETYHFSAIPVKQYSDPVEKIINYIQSNARINLTVEKIAKDLFISESQTRNMFKKEMGIPIGKYIDDIVFIKARQLLFQKMSIGEISQQLGFCDQFYFSRRFKEKFKQTPVEFRKTIQSENIK